MGMGDPGKVAVVIGVGHTRGTGAALARRFAREGLHTFIAGRTEALISAIAEEIRSAGGTATPVVTDTTLEKDVVRLLDTALTSGGSLDLVVYNAGNNRFSPLLEMDNAFFEDVWRLVCFGGFLVGREAARRMVPQGSGSILFTGASASLRARPPFTAFASAKAALRGVAQRFPQIIEQRGDAGTLDVDAIADAFWMLHTQHPTTRTLELDLRPYKEPF